MIARASENRIVQPKRPTAAEGRSAPVRKTSKAVVQRTGELFKALGFTETSPKAAQLIARLDEAIGCEGTIGYLAIVQKRCYGGSVQDVLKMLETRLRNVQEERAPRGRVLAAV